MKESDVKIGNQYETSVDGKPAVVQILAANPAGGWDGINLGSKRRVRINDSSRLAPKKGAKAVAKKAPAVEKAKVEPKVEAKAADATPAVTEAPKAPRPPRAPKTDGTVSCLQAATMVLEAANEPLNCQTIVDRMIEKGLWKTKGKTPAATIYAAIIREIGKKGADSRFRKTARGKFEFAS